MRIFQTQSMWDAKEGRWYEVFSVDGEQVSGEEYFRELEVEQCLEDDEIDGVDETSYCMCCECKDNEDCEDFECTCCKNEEIEEDYINNDLVIQCDCLECREEKFISMAHDFILNSNGCPDCILECLVDFADDMKNIGWESHKENITECNEDS